MGTPVIFVRTPIGSAAQSPPPVGPESQSGISPRAAREDHTHEGVHKVIAGEGIVVTPSNGLGDVTVAVRHWREPVPSATDLPNSGNELGDVRVTMDTGDLYVWTAFGWQIIRGSGGGDGDGGGGGGGGGIGSDLWGALNRLAFSLDQLEHQARPAFTAVSERYDPLIDGSALDARRSDNVRITNSSAQAAERWAPLADQNVLIRRLFRKTKAITVDLSPGGMDAGATTTILDGFDAGVSHTIPFTVRAGITDAGGAVSYDGSFDAGAYHEVDGIGQTYAKRRIKTEWREEQKLVTSVAAGGFEAGATPDVANSFDAGVVSSVARGADTLLWWLGEPSERVTGDFEAGATQVITDSVKRSAVVVSLPINLPFVPSRAVVYAVCTDCTFWISRDGGGTWVEATPGQPVSLLSTPVGKTLRVKAEVRGRLDGWAYAALP